MLRFNKNETRVMDLLYSEGTERYGAEIARHLGTQRKNVMGTLYSLEKKKIVRSKTLGRMKIYHLTEMGEAVAWALRDPESLQKAYTQYIKEGRRRRLEEQILKSIGQYQKDKGHPISMEILSQHVDIERERLENIISDLVKQGSITYIESKGVEQYSLTERALKKIQSRI